MNPQIDKPILPNQSLSEDCTMNDNTYVNNLNENTSYLEFKENEIDGDNLAYTNPPIQRGIDIENIMKTAQISTQYKGEDFSKSNTIQQLNTKATIQEQVKLAKILTYNIFLRPPFIKNNKDDYKNERTKLFLDLIHGYDIICLQELFGLFNQRKHNIIYTSMKQGFYYHAHSKSPSFFSSYIVDGGLVTLSRFPIVEKGFKEFKYGVFSDNLSQKGVLYTKIQINDTYLHLFNTHLQASYAGEEKNVKMSVVTRIDQLYLMRKFIKEKTKKNQESDQDLVLICGDFNVNARNNEYPLHFLEDIPILKEKFSNLNPHSFNEYDLMYFILSNDGQDQVIDTVKLKHNGDSPVTYADAYFDKLLNKEVPQEEALTIKEDLLQKSCLDYIVQFKIQAGGKTTDKCEAKGCLKIDIDSVQVEKFLVENDLFTQLSDHYGMSACINYCMIEEEISFEISSKTTNENVKNEFKIENLKCSASQSKRDKYCPLEEIQLQMEEQNTKIKKVLKPQQQNNKTQDKLDWIYPLSK